MRNETDIEESSPAEEPISLDSVLALVATGDQGAFAQLYDLVAPRVLGLVRRLLVDHSQSEEVTQEVFLEIWQQAPKFDRTRGTAISWMMTMAHRRAVDRIRASQAGRDRDLKIGIRDHEQAYDNVAETVETTIENERVKAAMSRLSELQRQAVTLAYYGGHTQSEVAELLSVPLGTVKTRMRDGLIRLREELGVAT